MNSQSLYRSALRGALLAIVWLGAGAAAPAGPPIIYPESTPSQPPAKGDPEVRFQQSLGSRGSEPPTVLQGPPAGVQPLAIDLYSSKNFYKDQASWGDPRYYRCNTPRQIVESMWESGRIGPNPPTTASWGDCKLDYPRAKIVSPYPYKSAKEHYEALLAAARKKGGPTKYTKATTPDWDGFYIRDEHITELGVFAPDKTAASPRPGDRWQWGGIDQASTIMSLLTPEYQTRFVQNLYHEGVTNSKQWSASFCYPEGFIRWWSMSGRGPNFELSISPTRVEMLSGVADNFLREVLIGRSHVQKVPQWYGETVGFWDGDTLVAWTANIQPWTQHTMFEASAKMETLETYKPAYDAAHKFVGIEHEAIWYDPEAFVQPLRLKDRFLRRALPGDPDARFTFIECLSNIKNVNGRPVQRTKADPDYIDYYGRPWAQNWEKYFEQGWEKPTSEGVEATCWTCSSSAPARR
ncbi:MAG: hypothetical protein ABIO39_12015 [Caulobacteraceae bacterium]